MEREDVDLDKNAPFLFGLLLVALVDLLRRRLLPLTLVLLLSERFLSEIEFLLLHFPRERFDVETRNLSRLLSLVRIFGDGRLVKNVVPDFFSRRFGDFALLRRLLWPRMVLVLDDLFIL